MAGHKRGHTEDADRDRKIFVGALAKETTANTLKNYFNTFGPVVAAEIMVDPDTGLSRGYGFVTFEAPHFIDRVVSKKGGHLLDGKMIDPKKFLTRDLRPKDPLHDDANKIFLGGIPLEMNEDELKEFFTKFGKVTECAILLDAKTNKSRGFGFVTMEDQSVINTLVKRNRIEIGGKMVEIKSARPRTATLPAESRVAFGPPRGPPFGGGPPMGFRGGGGGGPPMGFRGGGPPMGFRGGPPMGYRDGPPMPYGPRYPPAGPYGRGPPPDFSYRNPGPSYPYEQGPPGDPYGRGPPLGPYRTDPAGMYGHPGYEMASPATYGSGGPPYGYGRTSADAAGMNSAIPYGMGPTASDRYLGSDSPPPSAKRMRTTESTYGSSAYDVTLGAGQTQLPYGRTLDPYSVGQSSTNTSESALQPSNYPYGSYADRISSSGTVSTNAYQQATGTPAIASAAADSTTMSQDAMSKMMQQFFATGANPANLAMMMPMLMSNMMFMQQFQSIFQSMLSQQQPQQQMEQFQSVFQNMLSQQQQQPQQQQQQQQQMEQFQSMFQSMLAQQQPQQPQQQQMLTPLATSHQMPANNAFQTKSSADTFESMRKLMTEMMAGRSTSGSTY